MIEGEYVGHCCIESFFFSLLVAATELLFSFLLILLCAEYPMNISDGTSCEIKKIRRV